MTLQCPIIFHLLSSIFEVYWVGGLSSVLLAQPSFPTATPSPPRLGAALVIRMRYQRPPATLCCSRKAISSPGQIRPITLSGATSGVVRRLPPATTLPTPIGGVVGATAGAAAVWRAATVAVAA